jgi:hypothetical protein
MRVIPKNDEHGRLSRCQTCVTARQKCWRDRTVSASDDGWVVNLGDPPPFDGPPTGPLSSGFWSDLSATLTLRLSSGQRVDLDPRQTWRAPLQRGDGLLFSAGWRSRCVAAGHLAPLARWRPLHPALHRAQRVRRREDRSRQLPISADRLAARTIPERGRLAKMR